MLDERAYKEWRETTWRRDLTPAELAQVQAWLAAHPEAREDWELELALSRTLGRLPDAPVPTNFTARVLQEMVRDPAVPRSQVLPWWRWRFRVRWVPRVAFASILIGGGLLSYHEVQAIQRAQIARSVAAFSGVASLPSPQILTNFETIRVLERNATPPPDLELLQLLR